MSTERMCHWHKEWTSEGVLVAAVETGSGPGAMFYACPDCRERYGLQPLDPNGDSAPGPG
ncbi:hypothetical protein [Streptomyces sp. 8N706]|uniref:hypothetical protein n=1 Tax=Streptomyces sp. 8N706 TaxID=3457416 RepID=UPI003FD0B2B3